jgi:hypothetical protein
MERENLESISIDKRIIIKLITKKEFVGECAECDSGLG